MTGVVPFLEKKEVYLLIRENLGEIDDVQIYFDRYFAPYSGGFIPLIDLGELRFFTEEEALDLVEKRIGFPHPSVQYLSEYFYCDNDRYIPRVNFAHLKKTIQEKKLVEKLGGVIELPRTDQRRQAVMMDVCNAIKKHRIDVIKRV